MFRLGQGAFYSSEFANLNNDIVKSQVTQDAAANADVLSVYFTTILYIHLQLLIDIERERI